MEYRACYVDAYRRNLKGEMMARTRRIRSILLCLPLALPAAAVAAHPAQAEDCANTTVLTVDALARSTLDDCGFTNRTLIVGDMEVTIPEPGIGVSHAVVRAAEAESSLPNLVELHHSASGGVAVSIDGGAPVGDEQAVSELRATVPDHTTTGSVVTPMAIPSWCGSGSQYSLSGKKWPGKLYQWFENSSGRPMTYAAFDAAINLAENRVESQTGTCGSHGIMSLSVGGVGSRSNTVGVKDGSNIMGWKALPSGTLAQATTWSSGTSIVEADITFSTSVSWYAGTGSIPSTKYDVASVAVHEILHAVGMSHVSSTPKQVLYPSFNKGENRRDRRAGDYYGLELLY